VDERNERERSSKRTKSDERSRVCEDSGDEDVKPQLGS
jgi:hypothetical protein